MDDTREVHAIGAGGGSGERFGRAKGDSPLGQRRMRDDATFCRRGGFRRSVGSHPGCDRALPLSGMNTRLARAFLPAEDSGAWKCARRAAPRPSGGCR
ncbi:MAG: hypothetical protein OXC38_09805 [Gammaproteobacteria bacterium]|nr:hypothetical protein [Gammaproteobacteria bacterium]